MEDREAIRILSDELKLIEAVIAYSGNFKGEKSPAMEYRIKRKDAIKKAVSAMEKSAGTGAAEELRKAMDRVLFLETELDRIGMERDLAVGQLAELGLSPGDRLDSVKEALKKYNPEPGPCTRQPGNPCPCCGYDLGRPDRKGAGQQPGFCPRCMAALWKAGKQEDTKSSTGKDPKGPEGIPETAEFTGDVFQPGDAEYSGRTYFVLQDSVHKFTMELSDILLCLKFAEREGFIPELPGPWWTEMASHYPTELRDALFYDDEEV